jgi:hypothetical protein
MRVQAHGLRVETQSGWEVRIRRRPPDHAEPGARARPMLHAATVPLPEERGDFGGSVTPALGPDDAFVSLFEYEPEAASTALFTRRGRPRPTPADFSPRQLQRTLPGQSGVQYFFADRGRAFCLYVVLGSHARRASLVRKVNALLDSLEIDAGGRP